MEHWTEGPWIGFDTETTGIDTKTARILQAAIITDDPSGVIKEVESVWRQRAGSGLGEPKVKQRNET